MLGAAGRLHYRDIIGRALAGDRVRLLVRPVRVARLPIGPLRRIEDDRRRQQLPTHAGPGAPADALRLSVALRNRSAVPLAMPTIDLSLTDINGELVARRALSPADFRARPRTLAPGAESPLQLLLTVDGRRVAGYTVEIFYP